MVGCGVQVTGFMYPTNHAHTYPLHFTFVGEAMLSGNGLGCAALDPPLVHLLRHYGRDESCAGQQVALAWGGCPVVECT